MITTKYPLGFAGFVDSATGSIIETDTVMQRQSPIPTGPLAKDNPILELNLVGRQAPIPTGPLAKDNPILELNLVGRQQAIIEAQKRLEAAIVELTLVG